jgi:hypothetical protein
MYLLKVFENILFVEICNIQNEIITWERLDELAIQLL